MISLPEARALVLSSCAVLEPERVESSVAAGQVLAEELRSSEDVPSFANSAMDGYALRAADTASAPVRLQVVGHIMAGDVPSLDVASGQAVRIMTGAPMPPGADAVCMIERTRPDDDHGQVVVDMVMEPGANVRRPGEDIAAGDVVFRPGTVLGPAHVGVLASIGVEAVLVHRRPMVGVVSTGDELLPAGAALSAGRIRDANRPALLSRLACDGFPTIDLGAVGDDERALADLLVDAAERCHAVVASGGVSVGDRDVVRGALEKLEGARFRWMQVAVKPAKPFGFATLGQRGVPVFGLPGNPVSALVSYELFVRPALRAMAGHRELDRPRVAAVADDGLPRRPDGKLHLVRVTVSTGEDGAVHVRLSGGQGSHMLRAMADADALALVPDGQGVPPGGRVEVMLLEPDRLGG